LAEIQNIAQLGKALKKRKGVFPEGETMKGYLEVMGNVDVSPQEIAKNSKSPTDFVHNLVSVLAHETGGHSRTGQHPDMKQWSGRKPSPRKLADYPTRAQAEYPEEFSGQVQMDVVRQRMLKQSLVDNLLRTSSDPSSPIARIYRKLTDE